MNVDKKLQQFGLGDKEAKMYIALCGLDSAGVTDIAKKAGIHRSTSYIILETLKSRGLVHVIEKNNIQYYSAITPKKFKEIAKKELDHANDLVALADEIVDELGTQTGYQTRPTFFVYEGNDGLHAALKRLGFKKCQDVTFNSLGEFARHNSDKCSLKVDNAVLQLTCGTSTLHADVEQKFCYIIENDIHTIRD